MTATTGPSESERHADSRQVAPDAIRADPRAPDHLMIWATGDSSGAGPLIVDEATDDPGFMLADWVTAARKDHPGSIVAATFPRHFSGRTDDVERRGQSEWLQLTEVVAGIEEVPGQRAFTGDTTPTSLSSLRRWANSRLEGRPVPVEDVVLALSELSTNVERHGGDWLTVDLVERERDVVLAVTDPAWDRLPAPRQAGPHDVTGRGLLVVASLALRWGLVVHPSRKTVWAAFAHLE